MTQIERDPYRPPTDQERELLEALLDCRSKVELLRRLGVSPFVLSHRVSFLLRRCGCRNRAQLIAHALRQGWITLDRDR